MSIFNNKPKLDDLYFVFVQISNMIACGFNPQDSIADASKNVKNKILKKALLNVVKEMQGGGSVGNAFAKQKIFPKIISPIIIAGEKAGVLAVTFSKIAELFWLQINLYSKIKNSLLIPKIAFTLLSLLVIGYIKFAVPEYIKLYQSSNVKFSPLIMSLSNGVNLLIDYWPITIFMMFMIWQILKLFCQTNTYLIDRLKLQMPIFKTLHFYFLQHQFCSILHIMLSSGLLLSDALNQAAVSVENKVMGKYILKVRDDLLSGRTLEDSLLRNNKQNIFDNQLVALLSRSGQSGQEVNSLGKLLDYYERILKDLIDPTTTKISFLVLIVIGSSIAAMFFLSMTPMLDYLTGIITMKGR